MSPHTQINLEIVSAPSIGARMNATLPILVASEHPLDLACGDCGAILLHAEHSQVTTVMIRCAICGSYNSTDTSFDPTKFQTKTRPSGERQAFWKIACASY
jgi:hypothetical protein